MLKQGEGGGVDSPSVLLIPPRRLQLREKVKVLLCKVGCVQALMCSGLRFGQSRRSQKDGDARTDALKLSRPPATAAAAAAAALGALGVNNSGTSAGKPASSSSCRGKNTIFVAAVTRKPTESRGRPLKSAVSEIMAPKTTGMTMSLTRSMRCVEFITENPC